MLPILGIRTSCSQAVHGMLPELGSKVLLCVLSLLLANKAGSWLQLLRSPTTGLGCLIIQRS